MDQNGTFTRPCLKSHLNSLMAIDCGTTADGCEILHRLIGGLSHDLQGFKHPFGGAGFPPSTVVLQYSGIPIYETHKMCVFFPRNQSFGKRIPGIMVMLLFIGKSWGS